MRLKENVSCDISDENKKKAVAKWEWVVSRETIKRHLSFTLDYVVKVLIGTLLFHKDTMCFSNCTATSGALCGPSASVALPACFPLEVFEMLITSPPLFFSSSSLLQILPPTTSGSWRRKCGYWKTITISSSHRWGLHKHTHRHTYHTGVFAPLLSFRRAISPLEFPSKLIPSLNSSCATF